MTNREYRQDDTSDGYCPLCGETLANLTVAAQGYCERHGWVSADWTPNGARPANTAGPEGNEWTPRTASGSEAADEIRYQRERLDALELERERERAQRIVDALNKRDEGDDTP